MNTTILQKLIDADLIVLKRGGKVTPEAKKHKPYRYRLQFRGTVPSKDHDAFYRLGTRLASSGSGRSGCAGHPDRPEFVFFYNDFPEVLKAVKGYQQWAALPEPKERDGFY